MRFLLLLVPLIVGCASLHSQVFEKIHEGDSKDSVLQQFGQPEEFMPSTRVEGATVWYYSRGMDTCGVTLKENVVKDVGCFETFPTASNVVRVRGKGSPSQAHCTTQTIGNQAHTNCY